MRRHLVSERVVLAAVAAGQAELVVPPGALITALAREVARSRGVRLVEEAPAPSVPAIPALRSEEERPRTLAVGSDHAGFGYKEELTAHAESLGWSVTDVGTSSEQPVDYPDFAYAVARHVQRGTVRLGLMVDGVGVGSAIVANKLPGIRAALCPDVFSAYNARAHNDANLLTLGSRTMGVEVCRRVLTEFLTVAFEGGRHERRVGKIRDVEARFLSGS